MSGFGRERTPAVPAEEVAVSARESRAPGNDQVANPPREAAAQPDERTLLQAIRGRGVSRELLAYVLELGYDLESIATYVRKHGATKLAERVGFGAALVAPATRRHTRTAAAGGLDELIADGGLFALAAVLWLANGFFTVTGVMALFPGGPGQLIGTIVGIGIHVIISRIEYAYWTWRRMLSIYVVPLISAVILDVGTTHQGLITFVDRFFPTLLGAMPTRTLDHLIVFHSLWARIIASEGIDPATLLPVPLWWPRSLVFLAVATFLAIGSERLMRRFRRGFVETWRLRYGTS